MNKTAQKILFLSAILVLFYNCSDDDDDDTSGNWVKKSTFNEEARSNSAAFTIGNIGYL